MKIKLLHSFILLILSNYCYSQIKGTVKKKHHLIQYVNKRVIPNSSDLKLDSLKGIKRRAPFYYDHIKFIEDTLLINYEIDTILGKFNGRCKIWDKNNNLLIEGYFKDNLKDSLWKFYSHTGNIIDRKYTNGYNFTQKTKSENTFPKFPIIKNEIENLILHPEVNEKDIHISIMHWRYIPSLNNNYLFKEKQLWESLKKYANDDLDPQIFNNTSFDKKISQKEAIKRINEYDSFSIIGYKTKELYYIDSNFSNSFKRVIGICPVMEINDEAFDFLWFFYPDIRNVLSKTNIKTNKHIKTLDDVFFFNHYSSLIYHLENVYNEKEQNINITKNITTLFEFNLREEIYRLWKERTFILETN